MLIVNMNIRYITPRKIGTAQTRWSSKRSTRSDTVPTVVFGRTATSAAIARAMAKRTLARRTPSSTASWSDARIVDRGDDEPGGRSRRRRPGDRSLEVVDAATGGADDRHDLAPEHRAQRRPHRS